MTVNVLYLPCRFGRSALRKRLAIPVAKADEKVPRANSHSLCPSSLLTVRELPSLLHSRMSLQFQVSFVNA